MFSIMLLIIMQGCEVENNKSKTSTVKFNGKIAKVKNSSELTQALQSDADKIILKNGNYNGDFTITKPVIIEGNSKTKIGTVAVETSGVKIQSPKIGTLLAGEGIEDGELELDNVTIEGDAFLNGGGENSITLKNTTITKSVIMDKSNLSLKLDAKSIVNEHIIMMKAGSILATGQSTKAQPSVFLDYGSGRNVDVNVDVKNLVVFATSGNVNLGGKVKITNLYIKQDQGGGYR